MEYIFSILGSNIFVWFIIMQYVYLDKSKHIQHMHATMQIIWAYRYWMDIFSDVDSLCKDEMPMTNANNTNTDIITTAINNDEVLGCMFWAKDVG